MQANVGDVVVDGMAPVTLSANQADEEVREFYAGLDIKVSKTVDKLDSASFKISITGDDGAGNKTDYSSYFDYYGDDVKSTNWANCNCLNYGSLVASNALGGILSEDVKIYIVPQEQLLRVIASVDGEGGSISPNNGFYYALDSSSFNYTLTASDGYEFNRLERYEPSSTAEPGNITSSVVEETTVAIKPNEFSSNNSLNVGKLKAYFSKKNYKVTLSQASNTENYKVYTSDDKQTEYSFGTNHEHGSNANLYFVPNEHYELTAFSTLR